MKFTIELKDRVSDEAGLVGTQWEVNDKWAFSNLDEVFSFLKDFMEMGAL